MAEGEAELHGGAEGEQQEGIVAAATAAAAAQEGKGKQDVAAEL